MTGFLSWARKNGPFLFLLAALVPWLAVQLNTALNTNHAWLLIAAGRLLNGGRLLTDFYEPNPPLSILIYIPAALLARLPGMPLYYTPYLVGLMALWLSARAVYLLLRAQPDTDASRDMVFVCAYILASTFLATNVYFAERDEFVIWGLVPFMLVQFAITENISLPRILKWSVLVMGTVAILIKPHYGLFSVILLLHRALKRRNILSILRDADFIVLTVGTLIYAVVIWAAFPEYLQTIFPDFVKFYIPSHSNAVVQTTVVGFCMAVVIALCASLFYFPPVLRSIVLLCAAGAGLALGLFALQGKGFYYHLIPAAVFLNCGVGLIIYGLALKLRCRPDAGAGLAIMALTALAYYVTPLNRVFPTHAQYRELKLTRLAAEAAPGQTFFIFSENMEMIHQASLYSGVVHASRFEGFWWLPGIERLKGAAREKKFLQYAGYVTEDMRRWHPRVMAIAVNLDPTGKPRFDFIRYMSRYPAFAAEMKHYRKTGQMKDNRRDYFRGTTLDTDYFIIYDTYRRID